MNTNEQIKWCHAHNAAVRFKHPNSVEVKVKGVRKIYAYSLSDAIQAIEEILQTKGMKFEHGCITLVRKQESPLFSDPDDLAKIRAKEWEDESAYYSRYGNEE